MDKSLTINPGINFEAGGTAIISFWSPEAEKVEIQAPGGLLPLNKADHGYWELRTALIQPGDTYRFVIDGKTSVPDPASLSQPEGVHGPSAAVDLTKFSWTDKDWQPAALGSWIIYELHVGTFSPEGTFRGLIGKLDYLLDLGINAIEIMPVAQFPGERNWGYDGVFPFAVQHSYGGAAGLQELVNSCHAKGISVILDVVYNHIGPEGNYFAASGPYFTEKYQTPWGSAVNFDDAWCDGVRRYFIANALMWFRDFHLDALRLDAVHAIKDFGVSHLLRDLRIATDQFIASGGKSHYLIAESDLNDPKYIDPLTERGYGMNAQWIDEFHHALRVTAGEPPRGYYSDFGGIAFLEKAYRDAYVYDGMYSPHREKTFGGKAERNAGDQFVVFSQNHDQVGNRMLGERTSMLVDFEMQKLMAGAVLCSPYLPMLFMGEEWGETHPFLFFTSHEDPELIKAVRAGRKAEFAAFHDQGEAPDPQDTATFNQSRLSWELPDQPGHQQLLAFYKAMIRLRKQYAPLHNADRKQLQVWSSAQKNCLLLRRRDQGKQVLCLMNFSAEKQELSIPDDIPHWKKIMDSAAPQWAGPAESPSTVNAGQVLTLQPHSLLIYTNNYV